MEFMESSVERWLLAVKLGQVSIFSQTGSTEKTSLEVYDIPYTRHHFAERWHTSSKGNVGRVGVINSFLFTHQPDVKVLLLLRWTETSDGQCRTWAYVFLPWGLYLLAFNWILPALICRPFHLPLISQRLWLSFPPAIIQVVHFMKSNAPPYLCRLI